MRIVLKANYPPCAASRHPPRQGGHTWWHGKAGSTGVLNRNDVGRKQALGLQLFATQADDHHLAAKVGVQADVAQGADGDLGARCVNRHTAAIGVVQCHHIIHVGELWQQFGLDALHGKVCDTSHALHGLGDGQDIARADRTIGIAKALKAVALKRRQRRWFDGR